jgi:hypothetical protein
LEEFNQATVKDIHQIESAHANKRLGKKRMHPKKVDVMKFYTRFRNSGRKGSANTRLRQSRWEKNFIRSDLLGRESRRWGNAMGGGFSFPLLSFSTVRHVSFDSRH